MNVAVYSGGATVVELIARPPIDPPIDPPPTPSVTTVSTRAMPDLNKVITTPGSFSGGEAYHRSESFFELAPTISFVNGVATLTARRLNNANFGAAISLQLELRKNHDDATGTVIASATTAANSSSVAFTVQKSVGFDPFAEGYWWQRVLSPAGWVSYDYPVYIRKGAVAVPQAMMPVVSGTYSFQHLVTYTPVVYAFAMASVPAQLNPITRVLTPRTLTPFATAPRRDQLYQEQLVPFRPEDTYRASKHPTGTVTSANKQAYFFSDFSAVSPPWALLDGPYGLGTCTCATSLRTSQRAEPNGKVYITDPWRFFVRAEDGSIRTLWGGRHASMAAYWNSAQTLEMVGTYDASVPQEYRRFDQEFWGMAWLKSSLETDPNAPPVDGDPPHKVGPNAFLTATKTGVVWRVVFPATSHGAGVGYIFTEDVIGPWACEEVNGVLYVTDRDANQVVAFDCATAARLWSVSIPAPTGICYLDGVLTVGQKTGNDATLAGGLWKIDIVTHAVTLWKNLMSPVAYLSNNSLFVAPAISDGTFCPRGTVGFVSWANTNESNPYFFAPNGSEYAGWWYQGTARFGHWAGDGDEQNVSYLSAIAIGQASCVYGSVQEFLARLSKALPTDTAVPATYYAEARKWRVDGFEIAYGNRGWNLNGKEQPWGKGCDAYLTYNGHAPT